MNRHVQDLIASAQNVVDSFAGSELADAVSNLNGALDSLYANHPELNPDNHVFTLVVSCDSPEQAMTVISERLGYDEEYDDPETGEPFDYRINVQELTP